MSAAPPPPDWVNTFDFPVEREPILAADHGRATQSIPRIILEDDPTALNPFETPTSMVNGGHLPGATTWYEEQEWGSVQRAASTTSRYGAAAKIRRRWRDMSFSTFRRHQMLAGLGFLVLLLVVAYGLQRGPLDQENGSTLFSGLRDSGPAGPDTSDDADTSGSFSKRFESNGGRAVTGEDTIVLPVDDGNATAPKLLAKGSTKKPTGESTGNDPGAAPNAEDQLDPANTNPGVAPIVVVRFENCAQAEAAGAAPIAFGQPGYRLSLDRDNDGLACENGAQPEPVPSTTLTSSSIPVTEAPTSTSTPDSSITSTTDAAPDRSTSTSTASSTTRSSTTSPSTIPSSTGPSSTTTPSTTRATTTTRRTTSRPTTTRPSSTQSTATSLGSSTTSATTSRPDSSTTTEQQTTRPSSTTTAQSTTTQVETTAEPPTTEVSVTTPTSTSEPGSPPSSGTPPGEEDPGSPVQPGPPGGGPG